MSSSLCTLQMQYCKNILQNMQKSKNHSANNVVKLHLKDVSYRFEAKNGK